MHAKRIALLTAVSALAAFNGAFLVFNDANPLEDLNNELITLNQGMRNIQARADAERRELTDAETAEIDALFARFEQVEDNIGRRTAIANSDARLAQTRGRQTAPENADAGGAATRGRAFPAPRDAASLGRAGFNSFGEFAISVRSAARKGGAHAVDPRLIANAAPSEYGSEGVGEDGGFAVPPDFRQDIITKIMGDDSLLPRTDQQITSSNNITWPTDDTNPGSANGIQAYWEGEGGLISQSKPKLSQVQTRLNKLGSLVPVTDEMLEDAPQLSNWLRTKTPVVMTQKINDAIVNGDGAGMPKGILESGSLITVSKQSGQVADTVVYQNITNMWSRMYAPYRKNAVWLINQDIEPQLESMVIPSQAGSTVGVIPAYLPPGGLSDKPYASLKGRPVIPVESTQALGSPGDIILADLTQYLTATKVGGLRQDVSIHLWFDYDLTAFRFIMRIAGQPFWNAPITPRNSQLTRSAFIALAQRS